MASNGKSVTVGWFEIPVNDMDRAVLFYNNIFEIALAKQDFGGLSMAWFPWNETSKEAGGSLIQSDRYAPRHEGTLVYFSSEDAEIEINRVEEAGGKVFQKKTEISPQIGYMALFEDSEENRIALHSKE